MRIFALLFAVAAFMFSLLFSSMSVEKAGSEVSSEACEPSYEASKEEPEEEPSGNDDSSTLIYQSPNIDPAQEETPVSCPFEQEDGWYLINSAADLRLLREFLDMRAKFPDGTLARYGKYRLTQAVDLSAELDTERGWIPIGSFLTKEPQTSGQWASFSGEFDGGGYAITGLLIRNRDLYTPHGLFGCTLDAVLRNVAILDCDIESISEAGAVAGQNTNGDKLEAILKNCYATGRVTGSSSVGGVLGTGERLENCGFEGTVTGVNDSRLQRNSYGIGGVVGTSHSMEACFARGTVTGVETVGGAASSCYRVKNCYFVGEVRGVTSVGGIIGSGAVVENCYSDAEVYGFEAVGGIAGHSATTYRVEEEPIAALVKNVLAVGSSINQIEQLAAEDDDFGWPLGRVLGFVGAGIGADQMYALETMQMNFTTKAPQNSFFWDGDHFPAKYLQDITAWQEILAPEGQWAEVWEWQDGYTPHLAWEKALFLPSP